MKVYFDVCCYNRPFDDCLDDRIELEANAIISIMYRCKQYNWEIVGSVLMLKYQALKMNIKEKR